MKNLAVLGVFLLSLALVVGALKAQANQRPRIVEAGLSAPVPIELAGKGKPRPDGGSTRDEEDLSPPMDSMQALRQLDPGLLEDLLRYGIVSQTVASRRR